MKLSLILPVYNAAGTLPALLDSVLSQKTRAEWEFLAMDDGSDDPGPGILAEAAKKDPRLRVFSLSRGGPAAARQAGLKRASGDWILFADADDLASFQSCV